MDKNSLRRWVAFGLERQRVATEEKKWDDYMAMAKKSCVFASVCVCFSVRMNHIIKFHKIVEQV